MRRLGRALLWLGVGIGAATGLGLFAGFYPPGWSWLMVVGFAKLATVSSLGVMAGGAVLLRLHAREERRRLIAAALAEDDARSNQ